MAMAVNIKTHLFFYNKNNNIIVKLNNNVLEKEIKK